MMEDTDCGSKCRVPDFAGSLSRTLSAGLYAGTLAENIYRNVFVQMTLTPSECTMVALNELGNVCSCLDDAVFAVEEVAGVVDCVFDVHELSGTDDNISGIDKLSGTDSPVFGICNVSGSGDGISGIGKPSCAGCADSIFSCGVQECIRECVLFLDGIRSLSASASECLSDGYGAISSVPMSGGCGSALSACGGGSVQPADGCSPAPFAGEGGTFPVSDNVKAVVMETLKDGIKALESALASLNGIVDECVD